MTKHDLQDYVVEALEELGGTGSIVQVAAVIWRRHEADLRQAGDLFYTWQYDMRWAATALRHAGIILAATRSESGIWSLRRGK